jgi:D-alanyl-lipoteichoic acid acyltransferase DltB (MBOAT superfamily)
MSSVLLWPGFVPRALVYAVLNGWLLYQGYNLCNRFLAGERTVFRGLEPGWIPGRFQDVSDPQFSAFRSSLLSLLAAAFMHIAVDRLICFGSIRRRMIWNCLFGLVFIFHCFGSKALFVLSVFFGNYFVGSYGVAPTWIFNALVLVTSKLYNGYSFAAIGVPELDAWTGPLDWQTSYNISLCRLISFNCDRWWAVFPERAPGRKVTSDVLKKDSDGKRVAEKSKGPMQWDASNKVLAELTKTNHDLSVYSLPYYMCYVLYVPLYLGGPVVTFNAFAHQIIRPQTHLSGKRILMLIAELFGWMALLEIATHFFYYDGVNDMRLWDTDALRDMSPLEIWFAGFFTLHFMWTKFMVIWRLFRCWSLLDGVDAPENMERWIHNNNTFEGFWRGWHASLNKWIIRYMYVPLGGSRTAVWSMWIIFTFVGLWHDLWWRWVAWAWFNAVFFSLEKVFLTWVRSARFAKLHRKRLWMCLKAVAGGLNIMALVISNLAIPHGFYGSYLFITRSFFGAGGLLSFSFALLYYSMSAVFQFEYVAWEESHDGETKDS